MSSKRAHHAHLSEHRGQRATAKGKDATRQDPGGLCSSGYSRVVAAAAAAASSTLHAAAAAPAQLHQLQQQLQQLQLQSQLQLRSSSMASSCNSSCNSSSISSMFLDHVFLLRGVETVDVSPLRWHVETPHATNGPPPCRPGAV